ncbi:MAG: hypothetical protein ACK52Y_14665, partial [Planctomycetota bacterium]
MLRAFLSAIKSFLLLVLLSSPSVAQEPIRQLAPTVSPAASPPTGSEWSLQESNPPVQTEPPTSQLAAEDSGWTPGV